MIKERRRGRKAGLPPNASPGRPGNHSHDPEAPDQDHEPCQPIKVPTVILPVAEIADVQNHVSPHTIDIDKVGVKGISYPIIVLDRANGVQHTWPASTCTSTCPTSSRAPT